MESQQVRFDLLNPSKGYSLIAVLPKNSVTLAIKAEEAGYDFVVVCIESDDVSYPGHYGSFDLHEAYIKDILSTLKIGCGINIGASRQLTRENWERIVSCGFSFVEMYAHIMPVFLLSENRLRKVAQISTGYMVEQVRYISRLEGIDCIEVATTPPQLRGSNFSVLDFVTLEIIREVSKKQLLLRLQKKVEKDSIIRFLELGVKGIVVDPCILAGTDETYREEIENLSPRRAGPE